MHEGGADDFSAPPSAVLRDLRVFVVQAVHPGGFGTATRPPPPPPPDDEPPDEPPPDEPPPDDPPELARGAGDDIGGDGDASRPPPDETPGV